VELGEVTLLIFKILSFQFSKFAGGLACDFSAKPNTVPHWKNVLCLIAFSVGIQFG